MPNINLCKVIFTLALIISEMLKFEIFDLKNLVNVVKYKISNHAIR